MPNFSIFHLSLTVTMILGLVACNKNVRETPAGQSKPIVPISSSPSSPTAEPQLAALEAPVTIPIKKRMENALLKQAQKAFSVGSYTSPAHNNAYDKFQSVLLINPQSERARAGIQAILLKYSHLIRLAISEGRLRSATNYLHTAEIYYPANPLLMDLKQQIRQIKASYAQVDEVEQVPDSPKNYEDVSLSSKDLNRKSKSLHDLLVSLAQRIEQTDEGVLIYARSDREGRWIYKQMNEAVPGYRLRGDIRVSRSPKIRILPPF